jgi:ribosomal protein S18 acetylase RimI-like enzyme
MTCYLTLAADCDFDFVYELKKVAYREYVEQTWGWDDAFQFRFHRQNFAAGNTYIIYEGDKRIGSVDVKEGADNIFLSGLYILPRYQSKGIGTAIINQLFERALTANKRLELEVLKVNVKAQKLYEKLGFTKTDRDETKYFMYK